MIQASCHCGAVRLEIARAPQDVTDCNCSICRKLGVLWAYYPPGDVRFVQGEDATTIYLRGERKIEFHSCRICGCTTHWSPVDKSRDRMGVNARLMDMDVLAAARVRKLDGAVTWQYLDE